MPDFPQDIVDEVDGDNPASGEQRAQSIEESGEYEAPPEVSGGSDQPQVLTQDQQVVMHKISEAIAMMVYGEQTNKPIIKLAKQGSLGVVYAVQMVMEKLRQTAKPGMPRELIPLAAMAALTLIDDFMKRLDPKSQINMREVVPMLIDRMSQMFEVTRAESVELRRLKNKINRANSRDQEAGPIGQAMPLPDDPIEAGEDPRTEVGETPEEENAEPPPQDEAEPQQEAVEPPNDEENK